MKTAQRLLAGLSLILAASLACAQGDHFTQEFPLASCFFTSTGGNPYFPLVPGRQSYFSNSDCVALGRCDELEELWITMKPETRNVTLPIGNHTRIAHVRVMEERETHNGALAEISRNFVTDCFPSHDVYYFGEEVNIYENGKVVDHEGEWLAGRHGARPGILMPEDGFMVGSRYYQEVAPDVALDRAEHTKAGFSVQVPAGKFDHCVEVVETTPLEPDDKSIKVYCRGVGLVKDDDLELTAIYGTGRSNDTNEGD